MIIWLMIQSSCLVFSASFGSVCLFIYWLRMHKLSREVGEKLERWKLLRDASPRLWRLDANLRMMDEGIIIPDESKLTGVSFREDREWFHEFVSML